MSYFSSVLEVKLPALPAGQYYIYVLENSDGRVKVGRTHDIQQRLTALSGSNGGGSRPGRVFVSEPTHLYTLERITHGRFAEYRIAGTEWFYGVPFEEVAVFVSRLFQRPEYARSEVLRTAYVAKYGPGIFSK